MLLATLTAGFLAGLFAVALGWVPVSAGWLTGLGLIAGTAAVSCRRRRPFWCFVALLTSALCWGALLAPSGARSRAHASVRGRLARASFEVTRSGCGQAGCWSEARLVACAELEPQSCPAPGAQLGVASDAELPRGARATALVTLKPRSDFRNPRTTAAWPDLRPALQVALRKGTRPRIDALSALDGAIASARAAARAALDRSLPAPHAGVARALLLGDGAAVDRDLNDAIRAAGVSHVLAVSGMHVTLLAGAAVALVRAVWLWTPLALIWEARRVSAGLGVLLAPGIGALCGAAPSALRAAWTSALMYLLVALGLRPCAVSVAALVVALYAAVSPHDALHPGFVLSVLATAALLSAEGTGGGVRGAFVESLRAWLATAPFLLLCFGQTSLIALLANVALLPLGTVLVPLAALHLGCALLGLASFVPSGGLFVLADAAFLEAARFCARLDPGLALPPLSALEVLATCAVASCLMLRLTAKTRGLVCLAAAACVGVSEWSLRHVLAADELRVTFLDVGQGDAILLESGRGPTALIDAGGDVAGGPDPGARAVLPVLRARRIARLDLVVLSHPHPDHYGGLSALLAAVPVRELWDTGQAEAELAQGAATDLLARARAQGARIRRPAELCGAPIPFGSARLEVHAPCPGFDEALGPNDNSFVLRLVHGARSVLLTGDIERAAEANLVAARARLRSDVLKVAHHGSRTSSTPALLASVQPWLAVVSAGRGNRFGHPHPEVVERLARAAEHVLRTDLVGGIEVRSDGRMLRVATADGSAALEGPQPP